MKFKNIIIGLIFFNCCVFVSVGATEDDYNKISEIFFPITKNWIQIENTPPIKKEKFTAIKEQLKTTFLESRISEKFEDKDCSFINRALEEFNDLNNFRLIDVDSDGVDDIFYTGSAQCREGNVFLIWYSTKKGFEVRQTILWDVKALKIYPGKDLKLSSVAVGCCADPIDEYYIGNDSSVRVDGIIKTTKTTVQPNKLSKIRRHFKNGGETLLRSSPEKKDAYDKSLSGLEQMAVFGNILSKYLPGVTGNILAEHKDKLGRRWVYVLLDEQSNMLRYHSPYSVNSGWILKQNIKEIK